MPNKLYGKSLYLPERELKEIFVYIANKEKVDIWAILKNINLDSFMPYLREFHKCYPYGSSPQIKQMANSFPTIKNNNPQLVEFKKKIRSEHETRTLIDSTHLELTKEEIIQIISDCQSSYGVYLE